jgi:hypothetical protein
VIHCREYWSLLMVPSGFWENGKSERSSVQAMSRSLPALH